MKNLSYEEINMKKLKTKFNKTKEILLNKYQEYSKEKQREYNRKKNIEFMKDTFNSIMDGDFLNDR